MSDTACLLLADFREGKGANPFLESEIFEEKKISVKLSELNGGGNIDFKIMKLTIGDYAIMMPRDNGSRLVAIIERKTWKDLAASIKDTRCQEQLNSMLELRKKTGCLLYYILEGQAFISDDTKKGGIKFSSLYKKVLSITTYGIVTLQTKDDKHTAKTLIRLCRALCKHKPEQIDFQGGTEITQEEIKWNVPSEMVKTKQLSNNEIALRLWSSIPGVGNETALALFNSGIKIKDLITENVKQTDLEIIILASGRTIGKAVCKKIVDFVQSSSDKLLVAIPGISITASQNICALYSIKQICETDLRKKIAVIKNGKRNIGTVVANNIYKQLELNFEEKDCEAEQKFI